jgi:hypothetical protein
MNKNSYRQRGIQQTSKLEKGNERRLGLRILLFKIGGY